MTSFESTLMPLEFLRPLWLIVFFAVLLFAGVRFALQIKSKQKQVKQPFIAPHLSAYIVTKPATIKNSYFSGFYLLAAIISLSLSGPSFRSVEVPLHEMEKAQVLVFDLSYSMYATDLKPNRLSQARYKAIDFIKHSSEGETALIAYAGDAFVISPLTTDANSILNQLPNLSPEIMPVMGSRSDLALDKAIELLKNSGYDEGHIIFISDGIDKFSLNKMKSALNNTKWIVSALAIGTAKGAPIDVPEKGLLKDNSGNIIIPKLKTKAFYDLTKAGKGLFVTATNSGNEVKQLARFYTVKKQVEKNQSGNAESHNQSQRSQNFMIDDGYWLTFLLLPLFLLLFRKGIFFALLLAVSLPFTSQPVEASIWKNNQQNAHQAYQDKKFQLASDLYDSPLEKGSAYYQLKDYKSALNQFKLAEIEQPNNSSAKFNKGNTLAKLNKYDEAIKAYQGAIDLRPDFTDAIENKKLIEDLKKQQEQQKNKDQQSKDQQSKDQQSKDQQNKDQQSKDQQSKDQQSKDQQSKDQQSKDQQSKDQQSKDQQSKDQQSKDQQSKDQQSKDQQSKDQQSKDQQSKDQKEKSEQAKSAQVKTSSDKQSEQEAMPLWMKNMPDDPSLLLRRKMQLEYQKRARSSDSNNNGVIW